MHTIYGFIKLLGAVYPTVHTTQKKQLNSMISKLEPKRSLAQYHATTNVYRL